MIRVPRSRTLTDHRCWYCADTRTVCANCCHPEASCTCAREVAWQVRCGDCGAKRPRRAKYLADVLATKATDKPVRWP